MERSLERGALALFVALLVGCTTELEVRRLEVTWDASARRAEAEIVNSGSADAGPFLVYFNGEEQPISSNRRPQVSHSVAGLPAGGSILLHADFAPLAHADNEMLANVYEIEVLADPKHDVAEVRDDNNARTAPIPQPGVPQLDQKNLSSVGYLAVDSTHPVTQDFNVSHAGQLASIEIGATKGDVIPDSPFQTLDMEVGVRGGAVLGTQTLQASALVPPGSIPMPPLDPTVQGPAYFDFASLGITLQPGENYYFRLTHADTRTFRIGMSENFYGGGTIWGASQAASYDAMFKIVIVP